MLGTYLEAVEFELEIFLLVEELLESVSQNEVGVVEAAVLLIKLVILISTILLLFCLKLGDARGAHLLRGAAVGAFLAALAGERRVLSGLCMHLCEGPGFAQKIVGKCAVGLVGVVCGLMKVSHAAVPIKN